MSAQLHLWEDTEMQLNERLATLESDVKHLTETVERNRVESRHDRNNLALGVEAVKATVDKTNQRLDKLFTLLEQAQGAKKAVAAILAVLTFFGLTGVYTVYQFFNGLLKH